MNPMSKMNARSIRPIMARRMALAALAMGGAVALTSRASAAANNVGPLYPANNLADVDDPTASLNNVLPAQSGNAGRYLKTDGSAATWQFSDIPAVSSTTALAALPVSTSIAYLNLHGRQGVFQWLTGNFSALVTADTQQGIYVASNFVASTSGCWVRADAALKANLSPGFLVANWFGIIGDDATDNYAATQAAFNVADISGYCEFIWPAGTYLYLSSPIASGTNITFTLQGGAVFHHNTTDHMGLQIQGANCILNGGEFLGPAAWSPGNGSTRPTFAVIFITGNNCIVRNVTVTNIYRFGIGFSNCDGGSVFSCRVNGNLPQQTDPLTLTVHFAIFYDPGAAAPNNNFVADGNIITTSTQGIFVGNYDSGALYAQGVVVSGNLFFNIYNHGVYSNYTAGIIISGNNFSNAALGVAASGPNNVVDSNSFFSDTSVNGLLQGAVGVSLRDPINCLVSNNSFIGYELSDENVIIYLQTSVLSVSPQGNVVSGNSMVFSGASGTGIRIAAPEGVGTKCLYNRIEGNYIEGIASLNGGLIEIFSNDGTVINFGNSISDNTIVMDGVAGTSGSSSILLVSCAGGHVSGNTHVIKFNAAGATSLSLVELTSCNHITVENEKILCDPSSGTNITAYGVREFTAGGSNAVKWCDSYTGGGSLAAFVAVAPIGSDMFVMLYSSGAPTFNAAAGSFYLNSAGGVNTTGYTNTANGNNWAVLRNT